jgi:sugar/nucleoside kinase (ribokinase family)
MGKVGDDFFGRAILHRLREVGLDRSMRVVRGEHSSYTVAIAPRGIDRIFLHCPGANDTFGAQDVNYDVVARARVFHFGYPPLMRRIYERGAAELTRIFRRARATGAITSLDMSLPDARSPAGRVDWDRALKRTLPYVDLFLPSAEESLFMLMPKVFARRRVEAGGADLIEFIRPADLQAVADKMLGYGARVILLKCGHRGLYLRTAGRRVLAKLASVLGDPDNWADRELWEPTFHVKHVASATGSGDSAIAGFLAALVRGRPAEECLRYACAVGSFNVTAYDAVSGIRSWAETTRAIRRGWKKDPLRVDAPGWRHDRRRAVWISPRDAVLGCAR